MAENDSDYHRGLEQAADLIAHRVRNALNGLQMGTELLLRKHRALEQETGRQVVGAERITDAMSREVQGLLTLSEELLLFAKGVVPKMAPLDLCRFVPKMTQVFTAAAQQRRVDLRASAPAEAVVVHADAWLLHRVIKHLIENALDKKALPQSLLSHVHVCLTATDAQARVDVSDDGAPIADATLARLFEPFATDKSQGIGLGLALSQQITRAHGGDTFLSQSAAGGVVFTFVLPRVKA